MLEAFNVFNTVSHAEIRFQYMCHELAVKVRADAERRRGVLAIDVGPWLRSCSGHFTLMSSEGGTCVSVAHARAHIDAHIDLEFFLNAEPQEVKDKCHDSSCSDHDDR